jgi:hypothetical protein
MITFDNIFTLFVIIIGIITLSKYIVLWLIKGMIKFKLIKSTQNQIKVKEYIIYKI